MWLAPLSRRTGASCPSPHWGNCKGLQEAAFPLFSLLFGGVGRGRSASPQTQGLETLLLLPIVSRGTSTVAAKAEEPYTCILKITLAYTINFRSLEPSLLECQRTLLMLLTWSGCSLSHGFLHLPSLASSPTFPLGGRLAARIERCCCGEYWHAASDWCREKGFCSYIPLLSCLSVLVFHKCKEFPALVDVLAPGQSPIVSCEAVPSITAF